MHMLDGNHLGALATLVEDRLTRAFAGLSPSACSVLLTLLHWQPLTVSELAAIIAVSQPTATRVVDGLVRAGLVERGRRQGREIRLSLTESGHARAQELTATRDAELDALLAPLEPADRAAFARVIGAVLAAATGSRAEARTTCRFCDHETCDGPECPVGSRVRAIEGEPRT